MNAKSHRGLLSRTSVALLLLLVTTAAYGQQDSVSRDFFSCNYRKGEVKKGSFYFAFGYNKNWYSKTNVHVHDESGDYDFKLYGMTARDQPHFNELFKVAISIPQYGYRIGYWMPNEKWGFEIKFDHAKYIVDDYQTVRLKGRIHDQYYDQDTLVSYSFLHLEHTDGANFLMANLMYRKDFVVSRYIRVAGVVKFGAGIVVPRSDVTLFGQRWNHCFHVAGQIAGGEAGIRTEFFRFFFIEASAKGVFANFNSVLAVDDVLISHRFWDGMLLMDAGFQFPMGKARRSPRKTR